MKYYSILFNSSHAIFMRLRGVYSKQAIFCCGVYSKQANFDKLTFLLLRWVHEFLFFLNPTFSFSTNCTKAGALQKQHVNAFGTSSSTMLIWTTMYESSDSALSCDSDTSIYLLIKIDHYIYFFRSNINLLQLKYFFKFTPPFSVFLLQAFLYNFWWLT